MRAAFAIALSVLLAILGSARTASAGETTASLLPPNAPDAELATRGHDLMQSKGCFACHSTDGSPRTGPTFRNIWGTRRPVITREGPKDLTVDAAYILRALRDPDADVAIGYSKGSMPKFDISDSDANAIVHALEYPELVSESRARRGGSLVPLLGSCLGFVLLHFLLSAIPVRRQVIAAVGEKAYTGIYSLIALATFAGMIVFYRTAPFVELWAPPQWTRWVPVLAMPLAILLMVAGFSTRNATAVHQEDAARSRPIGIVAVTRHPGLWGFAVWGLAHLATNGELHVVVVAGAIVVLAIGGMLHIDSRRKATLGADWEAYAAQTSLVPFVAIARGHTRLVPAEVGLRRVLIAAVVYVVVFFAHPHVIGASPSP